MCSLSDVGGGRWGRQPLSGLCPSPPTLSADLFRVCGGHNGEGRSKAPYGRFIPVSAGREHSCGIRSDGTVPVIPEAAGGVPRSSGTYPKRSGWAIPRPL